jgi:hypothetical protein
MTAHEFQRTWNDHIPEFPVPIEQIDLWLALHTEAVVLKGITIMFAKWNRDKHKMNEEYLIRYASKSMNNETSRTAAKVIR